jgi:hypothetical protein
MEAGNPGQHVTTKGLSSSVCLHYLPFWIHHYLKYVYAFFHPSKAATELLASKHKFNAWAAKFNVTISTIHVDNIVYTTTPSVTLGSIKEKVITMLLHAMHKWPDEVTEDMWPFAV